MTFHMKAIQFTIDEELLGALDQDAEVQRDGRSAVVRRAIAIYLQSRRDQDIRNQYRKAYTQPNGIDEELAGWPDQGAWPES